MTTKKIKLTGEAVRDFLFDTIDGMLDGSIDNKTVDARVKLASKIIKSPVSDLPAEPAEPPHAMPALGGVAS